MKVGIGCSVIFVMWETKAGTLLNLGVCGQAY